MRTYYSRRRYHNTTYNSSFSTASDQSQQTALNNMEIGTKIEQLLNNPDITDKDKQFYRSLKDQFEKKGYLSEKQIWCLDKAVKQHDPAEKVKRSEWEKTYISDYQEKAKLIAQYYKNKAAQGEPYFYQQISDCVLADGIPFEFSFRKMFDNKYAQKVLSELAKPAAFKKGNMVLVRKPVVNRAWGEKKEQMKKPALVLKVHNEVTAKNGGRKYTVLHIGARAPDIYTESDLKAFRG
jgi:hypothetical protein